MNTITKTRTGEVVLGALLACGILSSVLYIASDFAGATLYPGYRYADQAFSELLALGSPVRAFMMPLMLAYNLLVLAFAVGVWRAADGKRSLKISDALLFVYGLASLSGPYVPMHVRGTGTGLTDVLHIVCTVAMVLATLLAFGFGAAGLGKRFRYFSIWTFAAVLGFGVLTGAMGGTRMAAGLPTPWMGLVERANIYSIMLWIAVLGIALLRARSLTGATGRAASAGEQVRTKKVTVFVGSPHRGGATYTAARKFVDAIESYGDVEGELVLMSDYQIGMCRGCKACFTFGEERCPVKDDRDVLLGKMADSDAVVFASPNYTFGASAVLKVFFERLGFVCHRPRFHDKIASSIVVQGIFRGSKVREYLEFAAGSFGFSTVKGSVIRTLEPMTGEAWRKMDNALAEQGRRLHARLLEPPHPSPSLFGLVMFRMSRTGVGMSGGACDRAYYQGKGWLESEYYYPVRLGPFKKVLGALVDWAVSRTSMFDVADEGEQRSLASTS